MKKPATLCTAISRPFAVIECTSSRRYSRGDLRCIRAGPLSNRQCSRRTRRHDHLTPPLSPLAIEIDSHGGQFDHQIRLLVGVMWGCSGIPDLQAVVPPLLSRRRWRHTLVDP
jgi:hypothetical protein